MSDEAKFRYALLKYFKIKNSPESGDKEGEENSIKGEIYDKYLNHSEERSSTIEAFFHEVDEIPLVVRNIQDKTPLSLYGDAHPHITHFLDVSFNKLYLLNDTFRRILTVSRQRDGIARIKPKKRKSKKKIKSKKKRKSKKKIKSKNRKYKKK
jgi:hypothetical protein